MFMITEILTATTATHHVFNTEALALAFYRRARRFGRRVSMPFAGGVPS